MLRSLARTCENVALPSEPMDADPLRAPKEKSDVVMPLPTADQYSVVPDATLVVVIVVLTSDPSLMVVAEGVSK